MKVVIDVPNCYNCPFSHDEFREGLYCIKLRCTLHTYNAFNLKTEIIPDCPLIQYQTCKNSLVNDCIEIVKDSNPNWYNNESAKPKLISKMQDVKFKTIPSYKIL